jgi:hypothetical protein
VIALDVDNRRLGDTSEGLVVDMEFEETRFDADDIAVAETDDAANGVDRGATLEDVGS